MYRLAVQCAMLFCSIMGVQPMEKTSMYMKKSEVNDQSMSGTGYSYNGENGKPQEYSFELGDSDNGLKIFEDFGYDPFAESNRYAENNSPLPYDQYYKVYENIAPEKPLASLVNANNYNIPKPTVKRPSLYPHITQYKQLGLYPHAYPYAPGYHGPAYKNFLSQLGKIYGDTATSKRGEKVNKAYKTVDEFSKGLSGKYNNQDAKSLFGFDGGKKHLFFDNAGNYGVKNAAGKALRGGSFGQKDYHNKGSKTTGYRKAYHKDDYDKQHKFYDKADKSGYFKKYGDFDAKHGNDAGHFAKGAHENDGYAANKYGIADLSDKGKFEDVAKGFRNANGNEAFYQNYDGFAKKDGHERSSIGGYKF